ncbi:MAG: prepilin-type N-terminal cleavage/methylation domain-containing protein [Immundisolibacteraceae bacterium]|nr:prepilin-type N-terminal cleavage/methylation domain-containing protein [Immundisolibacteraceae bacterium]
MTGRRSNQQTGFTLIELIMVMVIVSIIAATGASTMANGVLAWRVAPDLVDTLSKLRASLTRAERELRETRRDPSASSSYDIASMTSSQFSFTKTDGTGVIFSIAPPLITIDYSSPAVTSVLVDQVSRASFLYFQQDGSSSATSSSDIAFVELQLNLANGSNIYPQLIRVGLRNQP